MAIIKQFEVQGFAELFNTLESLRDEFGKGNTDKVYKKALTQAITPVFNAIKERAPVESGQLKEHIYMKVHKPTSKDKKSIYYHEGEIWMARVTIDPKRNDTKTNVILNKRGKFQFRKVNHPVGLALEFGTAKMPARPFMRASLEEMSNDAVSILGMSLQLSLREFARAQTRGYKFKV